MSIKPIDKISVHKICSGQVVLNLAIAVKELVENSLDANATIIEVCLKENGSELIQVIDNGNGIEKSNFDEIAMKHSTSKLEEFSDLSSVQTLGFRGEALSSLCSLSDVSITTRHIASVIGFQLKLSQGGVILNKTAIARNIGTTVALQNIFYTLPVRRKEFLRNIKRELTKMVQMLTSYCLIHPNTKFICSNTVKSGKKSILLSTPGNSFLKDNIANIFGSIQLNSLKEFKITPPSVEILQEYNLSPKILENDSPFKIEGFISTCEHGRGRSSSDRQFLYINNRPCELTKVFKLINEVFHKYNRHQFPFFLLNITLNRDSVDINVTPDKRTIYVENEKLLVATIKASLLKLFEHMPATLNQNIINYFESPKLNSDNNDVDSSPNISNILEDELTCLKRKSSPDSSERNEMKCSKLNETIIDSDEEFCHSEVSLPVIGTLNSTPIIKDGFNEITPMEKLLSLRRTLPTSKTTTPKKFINPPSGTLTKFFTSQSKKLLERENGDPNVAKEPKDNDEVMILENDSNNSKNDEKGFCTNKIEGYLEILDSNNPELRKNIVALFSMNDLKIRNQRKNEKCEYIRRFRAKISQSENKNAEEELKRELCKERFKDMEIIGQFNLGFIITKLGSDLFIIDQHAADEKYNYEILQRSTVLETQKLFAPQKLQLTAVNESILLDHLEIFNKNGFDFKIDPEADAGHKVLLLSIPFSQNWTFGKSDIEELIFMLSDTITNGSLCRPSKLNSMFASRACRKSVMIGTALSPNYMKKLVQHMGDIDQPWNCPHGRPTIRHLVNLQLTS